MTDQGSHAFQAPKGTRDFYPAEMAVRRHIESLWRAVSVSHGFDEIDGPTYEHLDLYTVKSGPGIVSELFSFRRTGGDTDYALRPEFTPTLARMVAARAARLPRPVRWFCMPPMFRAERPQRGRLREHYQWNVDVIGDDSPRADAEVIAVAVAMLEKAGLRPSDVQVRLSDRHGVQQCLLARGARPEELEALLGLIDRLDRLSDDDVQRYCETHGLGTAARDAVKAVVRTPSDAPEAPALFHGIFEHTEALRDLLCDQGLEPWVSISPSIVRGLAYYTGTVFEIHETSGRERAIAGGGRYDHLVELFGGPPTPAVGFAMGDVVIRLVLEERNLLEPPEAYLPRPDVFVVNGREGEQTLRTLVARLRASGLHVRHSSKSTRNIGKLLGEAGRARARLAVILGDAVDRGAAEIKDLDRGEQGDPVPLTDIVDHVRSALAPPVD